MVIDTNLWVSLLLTKAFAQFDPILFGSNITLLFSQELLDEFIAVTKRPKFKHYFTPSDVQQLLESISNRVEFIVVTSTVDSCRDPKDNFLLSLAQDGKATHLLTGDKDLLDLKKHGRTRIRTIVQYLSGGQKHGI